MASIDITESRLNVVIAAMVIPRAIAWITVALRFYAKRIGRADYGWDDWIILIVATLLVPQMINEGIAMKFGMGRHVAYLLTLDPYFYHHYFRTQYASQLLYPPIIALTKLSILSLYLRLFGVRRSFALACYVQAAAVTTWLFATEFLTAFQCSPVSEFFELRRRPGVCFRHPRLYVATNAVDLAMCVVMLVTPLSEIWRLGLSWRKKILVTAALVVGGGETIISAVRLAVVVQLPVDDPTWTNATTCLWSTLQINVGVVCSCLPVMAPLLPKKWRERSYYSTTSGGGGGVGGSSGSSKDRDSGGGGGCGESGLRQTTAKVCVTASSYEVEDREKLVEAGGGFEGGERKGGGGGGGGREGIHKVSEFAVSSERGSEKY